MHHINGSRIVKQAGEWIPENFRRKRRRPSTLWKLAKNRDVQKTEIPFGFLFKNRTIQKFDIRSDSFLIETACSLPFK